MTEALRDQPTTSDGALRYITRAAIERAIASVREHRPLSLGLPIRHGRGPVAWLRQPPQHFMRRDGGDYALGCRAEDHGFGFADDVIILPTHGTTHADALCHIFSEGKMFGGISADHITSSGATALGAETIPPIVTRGLVIDAVPEGRAWLEPGEKIPLSTVVRKLDEAGFNLEPGDALLVRTGSSEAFAAGHDHGRSWPGLHADCIDFLKEKKISVLGSDNFGIEVVPSGVPGQGLPLHVRLMRDDGVLFVELLDLSMFAGKSACGLLTINPLKIVGGTASPLAPMLVI